MAKDQYSVEADHRASEYAMLREPSQLTLWGQLDMTLTGYSFKVNQRDRTGRT